MKKIQIDWAAPLHHILNDTHAFPITSLIKLNPLTLQPWLSLNKTSSQIIFFPLIKSNGLAENKNANEVPILIHWINGESFQMRFSLPDYGMLP